MTFSPLLMQIPLRDDSLVCLGGCGSLWTTDSSISRFAFALVGHTERETSIQGDELGYVLIAPSERIPLG